jgi:hypothetical protein
VLNDEFDRLVSKMPSTSTETPRKLLVQLVEVKKRLTASSPLAYQVAASRDVRDAAGGTDVALESKIESYLQSPYRRCGRCPSLHPPPAPLLLQWTPPPPSTHLPGGA